MNAEEKRFPIVETIEVNFFHRLKDEVNKNIKKMETSGWRFVPPMQVFQGEYHKLFAILTFVPKNVIEILEEDD